MPIPIDFLLSQDGLYYHYVGYLVAIGFTPLQIYNHLENEKRVRKLLKPTEEWTIEDTTVSLRKKMMERFKQWSQLLHAVGNHVVKGPHGDGGTVKSFLLKYRIELILLSGIVYEIGRGFV